ncbi:unnamed protein product [Brugia pahangi]|uniref:NifU_N domain-containing protein n=1 Tax=Brugia pahangi TaxID=6280 RepID=A0A0N4TTL5_BRUPA|nr:unnamed protein product [Brugia pahangi]
MFSRSLLAALDVSYVTSMTDYPIFLYSYVNLTSYNENNYENPRNAGSLNRNDPSVGTGLIGALLYGDVMKLQIKIDDKDVIENAKFKTFSCGSAIASSFLLTEMIKGKTIEDVTEITNTQITEELCLPTEGTLVSAC